MTPYKLDWHKGNKIPSHYKGLNENFRLFICIGNKYEITSIITLEAEEDGWKAFGRGGDYYDMYPGFLEDVVAWATNKSE
jgi:hypothetical protein